MVVNGYYEWREAGSKESTPFFFYPDLEEEQKTKSDEVTEKEEPGTPNKLIYLAALYNNVFHDKIGESYNHFVVLTMEA